MTSALEKTLRDGARLILGRPLTSQQAEQLSKYLDLLIKWQKVQRLVGSSDPPWIVDNLLLDSLLFVSVLPPRVRSLMDLGSGAGLPGIPLKIVLPAVTVTLVESRQKRTSFLSTAVRELGLTNTRVINARAEDLPRELEGTFDAVVMRCAGCLDTVSPLAERFLAPGGAVIATGPPEPEKLVRGSWMNVRRPGADSDRLFAVYSRP